MKLYFAKFTDLQYSDIEIEPLRKVIFKFEIYHDGNYAQDRWCKSSTQYSKNTTYP